MSEEKETTALATIAPVRALVSPQEAKKNWDEFLALKSALLTKDDYQAIAAKDFIKKSGFRKIAVVFNLSDRIVEQVKDIRDDGSFMWRITVEVSTPNRFCSGVGICDSRERKFAHTEHDVYSTAHTRAKNRAISDMVAGGAVSAEEMSIETDTISEALLQRTAAITKKALDEGLVEPMLKRAKGKIIGNQGLFTEDEKK